MPEAFCSSKGHKSRIPPPHHVGEGGVEGRRGTAGRALFPLGRGMEPWKLSGFALRTKTYILKA